jgi:hypothetical protein
MEAAPATIKHSAEFELLDGAVNARDKDVHAVWVRQFNAWVSGDHSGPNPFQIDQPKNGKCDSA